MSTGSIGQTQIRMVQPGTPRIGQTTIRPTTPQIFRTATPTMRPQIRGQTTIVQTNNQVPALHPVGGAIFSGGVQVRILGNFFLSFPAVENLLLFNENEIGGNSVFFISACDRTPMLFLFLLLFLRCFSTTSKLLFIDI